MSPQCSSKNLSFLNKLAVTSLIFDQTETAFCPTLISLYLAELTIPHASSTAIRLQELIFVFCPVQPQNLSVIHSLETSFPYIISGLYLREFMALGNP